MAWAFAETGQSHAALLAALVRVLERWVSKFKPQNLANTAWAFAKAGWSEEKLFAALERTAERQVGEFNMRELANTAWAFARIRQLDAKVFVAFARVAELRLLSQPVLARNMVPNTVCSEHLFRTLSQNHPQDHQNHPQDHQNHLQDHQNHTQKQPLKGGWLFGGF